MARVRESTDALLALCAFGQQVQVLAMGDALWQFAPDQLGRTTDDKPTLKNIGNMLASLPLYGVDEIHVLDSDLASHPVPASDFIVPVKPLCAQQTNDLLDATDIVLNY